MKIIKRVKIVMSSSLLFLCGIACGVTIMSVNTDNNDSIIISADDCVYNDLIYFTNDDNTITIKGHTEDSDMTDVVIPDEIDGKKVTCIGEKAFYDYKSMHTLYLGKNIISIGDYALYNTKLSVVSVADNIKDVAENALNNTEINKLIVPASVTHIPDKFYFNNFLTEITVDNGNKYYSSDQYGVLYNADKSTLIKYPVNSITSLYIVDYHTISIGTRAFEKSNLEYIDMSENVETIGDHCFYECNNVCNINLGENVKFIGDYAFAADFAHAPNTFNLTISSNISTIGICAFENADILRLTICDSVESIPDKLYCNSSLTQIHVTKNNKNFSSDNNGVLYNADKSVLIKCPAKIDCSPYYTDENTISIEKEAFKNCDITNIYIGDSVEEIGDYCFYDCCRLYSITFGKNIKSIGNYAFASSNPRYCNKFADIRIKGNLPALAANSFENSKILELCIFNGVNSIPEILLSNSALTEFYVENNNNNNNFSSDKGVLYNADKSKLIRCPANSNLYSYAVNDNTTIIENNAFCFCRNISEITISDNVESIGDNCFRGCMALSDIKLGKKVVSIGDHSFCGVDSNSTLNINQFTLSDNIQTIGKNAFEFSNISKINVPASVTFIPSQLYNNMGLTEISVAQDNKSYSSDKGVLYNADKSKLIRCPQMSPLRTYNVVNHTSSIETGAFRDTKVQNIFIDSTVKVIGDNAFENSSLKTIEGMSDSYAQTYAADNNYTFIAIDLPIPSVTTTANVSTTKKDTTSSTGTPTTKNTSSSTTIPTTKKNTTSSTTSTTKKYTTSSTTTPTTKKYSSSSTTVPTTRKDTTSSTTTSTDKPKINYDVNGDGKINIMDVVMLKKYILKSSD